MTRRVTRRALIIAAVVTVAALACVGMFWWEIWLFVAYEERVTECGVRFYSKKGILDEDKDPQDVYVPPGQICDYCRPDWPDDPREGGHCRYSDGTLALLNMDDIPGNPDFELIGNPFCICPPCHPERER